MTRPAGRERPGNADTSIGHEQVRVPRLFTLRVLVLVVVGLVSVLLVYPTLRVHLAQQAELNQTRRELAQARAENAALQNDLQRWDDPAYVVSQARTRLSFVMPGERAFRVVDSDEVQTPVVAQDGPAGSLAREPGSAWYADVWASVRIAGDATG